MTFPTRAQAERRLDDLRREREALDRAIADCLAFLDLGRRLGGPSVEEAGSPRHPSKASFEPVTVPSEPAGDVLPAGSAARRRGRAAIAACLAILRDAGRPLHVSEIRDRLLALGHDLPGADPIAALNTRLWKRSAPGGAFRRLGDAVYDLAEGPGEARA